VGTTVNFFFSFLKKIPFLLAHSETKMESFQSTSHHYSALLETVTDLRSNLEKTTSKIKNLEDQNYHLSSNYAVIKEELIDTRKKYNEIRENYLTSVNEKFDMERKQETFIERLKVQLSDKTKEFETIRDKLVPHDIDHLRIKVQEELEIQHKQELKILENEIEIQKEKFFNLKRDFEKNKIEYNSLILNQQQEIFALRSEKEAIDESFRKDLSTILSNDGGNSNGNLSSLSLKDEKIRLQASKANELTYLVDKLREEAVSLRKEKDQAVYSLEEYKSKTDQLLNSTKAKNASLEAERSGYQERISRLEHDIDKKEIIIRNQKLNIEEMNNQLDSSTKHQQELQRQLSSIKTDHLNEIEILNDTHNSETKDLHDSIDHLSMKVTEREDLLRKSIRESNEMQLRFESTEGELRRNHNNSIQELRKKYSTLEVEVVESKQTNRLLSEQISLLQEQHSFEKDSLLSEINRIKKEKEFLHSKLRELDNNLELQRKKILSIQQDHFTKNSNLEKKLRDVTVIITNLELKNESLLTKNNNLEKDKNLLEDSLNHCNLQNNELLKKIENMKKDFHSQLEALTPAFKEKAEELKDQLRSALTKERKRSEAYKMKALEAHNRVKTLTESRDF
jgi:chromosome segregation ATPase